MPGPDGQGSFVGHVEHPYVAISHLSVADAGAAALEDAFRARLGEVDAWPGFGGLEVLADQRHPGRYLMITRWASKEAFVAYMRSAAHGRSHARIPGGPDAPRAAGFEEFRQVAT
jgi:heme oxygenase (mycobilin-producing)